MSTDNKSPEKFDLRSALVCRCVSLHRDEQGTISILSVFALMFLIMLLGMVMNSGRHVSDKLRMQNAADSAAYSGGVVLARGMNTLAFTNHLLFDVFALTAFLREARDANSASYSPKILAAWSTVAPVFQSSGFPKFTALGSAIQQKVPMEQQMVDRYTQWGKAVSERVLPLMEAILAEELIPKYQRAVVEAFPDIAQSAARETALLNGTPDLGRGQLLGVLWRTSVEPVGVIDESVHRTLPVVDPELDSESNQDDYVAQARRQRSSYSHKYLADWNHQMLSAFDRYAKMSQFAGLWRSFTCGYLEKLLNEEYPRSNLPFQIRHETCMDCNSKTILDRDYMFISVVYGRKLPEILPGLFKNRLDADAQNFAQVMLFVPRPRLAWIKLQPPPDPDQMPLGGVPGEIAYLSSGEDDNGTNADGSAHWVVGRTGGPKEWSLVNQNWNCQLVPVTHSALATILQTPPEVPEFAAGGYALPNLQGLTSEDLQHISPH